VEKNPGDITLLYIFSNALLESGQTAAARTQLMEATRKSPGFLPARFLLADIELQTGQYNEAVQQAEAIRSIDPKNQRAQFLQGSALLGLGKLDQASTVFNNLLRDAPQSVDVHLELALVETRKKNFAGAEAAYRKILEASPQEFRAVAGLADTCSAQQRPDKALAFLSEELQKSHGAAAVRATLADTAVKAGKYDIAVAQYQQLVNDNPRSIDPLLQLAGALRLKNDRNGAIAALQKAASLQPDDVRPPSMLGSVLAEANRIGEAKVQFRRALSLKPGDLFLTNNLSFLLADTGDSLDEALKLARQTAEKAPGDPEYADTLAWVYVKKGMNDNAIQILRKLTAEHADNSTYSYHFGVALYQKGEMADARLQLGRALELQPTPELKGRIDGALKEMN